MIAAVAYILTAMEMSSGGNSIQEEVLARARKHYDEGVSLRQEVRFGEALNAFMSAIAAVDEALSAGNAACRSGQSLSNAAARSMTDAAPGSDSAGIDASLLEIRSRSEASIGLLREIIGFVNTDLMNP